MTFYNHLFENMIRNRAVENFDTYISYVFTTLYTLIVTLNFANDKHERYRSLQSPGKGNL